MAYELTDPRQKDDGGSAARTNHLNASVRLGSFEARVDLNVTPAGLMAVGGLVSAILLSVVPIVYAATRKLPRQR